MKKLSFILSIAAIFTLVITLHSCTQEELSSVSTEETVEQSNLLFHKIPVTTDKKGYFSFADDKKKIQPLVEELFTQKNQTVQKVDDFGLGIDKLGVQYFYIKEYTGDKVRSVFFFLNDKDELSKAKAGGGTECVGDECCTECVAHSSLGCTCHDINDDCMDDQGTTGTCSQQSVSVKLEPRGN